MPIWFSKGSRSEGETRNLVWMQSDGPRGPLWSRGKMSADHCVQVECETFLRGWIWRGWRFLQLGNFWTRIHRYGNCWWNNINFLNTFYDLRAFPWTNEDSEVFVSAFSFSVTTWWNPCGTLTNIHCSLAPTWQYIATASDICSTRQEQGFSWLRLLFQVHVSSLGEQSHTSMSNLLRKSSSPGLSCVLYLIDQKKKSPGISIQYFHGNYKQDPSSTALSLSRTSWL